MSNFSCLGRLKLLNYTFPGGRLAGWPAGRPNLKLMLTSAQLGQLGLGLSLAKKLFQAGQPAKPDINANLSPAWISLAWAELGKNEKMQT